MGKHNKKIKIIFLIINFILIFTISYFIFKEYNIYNNKTIINNKNKINIQKIDSEKNNILKEIDELKENITNIREIDKTINNKKEEVFKLASELEKKIKNKESDKKIIYLTFDDGPYYNTYKVLNILKKYNVKATFFTTNVNGNNCYDNPSYNCHLLYKEIAKDNHTIANHTYSHGWNRGLYASANSFMDAIIKQEELIKSYTGITTNITRFPGGSNTAGSRKNLIIEELRKRNYGWVDWTAEDGDGSNLSNYNQGWSKLMNTVTDDIEVVLFHDYHPVTTQILPNFIEYLEKNNYIILPLFYDSVMINK